MSGLPPRRQWLSREDRLRRRADFVHCYRRGRRRSGALVIVYFAPNTAARPRLGSTVSKKVGNSVVRHRVKRRIREIFRRSPHRPALGGVDLVVHVKPAAATAAFPELARELDGLLAGLGRRR